ncbi:Hypothetical predicted protein [Lecanosticta acicola]|uniref:Uncharacterized protein n=1 Tax=Lecanosticta acicola TaxID=111012 RepID=A0AAI8YYI4_9PEZI|nr:Hypothetical predicted protein [Lecanosticta acicola]
MAAKSKRPRRSRAGPAHQLAPQQDQRQQPHTHRRSMAPLPPSLTRPQSPAYSHPSPGLLPYSTAPAQYTPDYGNGYGHSDGQLAQPLQSSTPQFVSMADVESGFGNDTRSYFGFQGAGEFQTQQQQQTHTHAFSGGPHTSPFGQLSTPFPPTQQGIGHPQSVAEGFDTRAGGYEHSSFASYPPQSAPYQRSQLSALAVPFEPRQHAEAASSEHYGQAHHALQQHGDPSNAHQLLPAPPPRRFSQASWASWPPQQRHQFSPGGSATSAAPLPPPLHYREIRPALSHVEHDMSPPLDTQPPTVTSGASALSDRPIHVPVKQRYHAGRNE